MTSVLQCIEQSLDRYGESVKKVLFWKVEETYHISRSQIVDNPEKLHEAIVEIFGVGSKLITNSIVEHLAECFPELKGQTDPEELISAIKMARKAEKDQKLMF